MQQHSYDVVIVGAGGAGMRAALESSARARTAVLTKLYPTRAPTGAAQGGMAAALANVEDDNWEWHTYDTVHAGDYLVDQDAAEVMCREATDAVLDLEKLGLPFSRTPQGRVDQRHFGGHTRDHGAAALRRSSFAADLTGHLILQTLYQNCVRQQVEFYNEFYVLDLLLCEGRAAGVVAYQLATGELHVFAAKAVVLATGGFGKVFATTSNAHTQTGDGMGIASRSGLPLEDLEFFQFHPTGLAGLGILLSEAARGAGGTLRNGDGEQFMARYAPLGLDLAPSDVVARAMVAEVRDGRGAGPLKDHLLLDLTHLPGAGLAEVTGLAATHLGVDARTEQIPVYPTAHYAMGGVPTTTGAEVLRDNENIVPGLYAAGEVACVSVHGANRLATNSLLDVTVFGRRAGIAAAEYAAGVAPAELPDRPQQAVETMLRTLLESNGTQRVADIRSALQHIMDRDAQVRRSEQSLARVEGELAELRQRYAEVSVGDSGTRFNTDLMDAVELGFLLDLAELLVVSARGRTESRGAHFRADHPDRDDVRFLRHTMAYREADGAIRLDYKPVVQTRYPPTERRY